MITWHYLTDANAWFTIDSGLRRRHLRWYDRIPLEFDREQDFDTLIAKWRAYMRFSSAGPTGAGSTARTRASEG